MKEIEGYAKIIKKSNLQIDNSLDELIGLYELRYLTNYKLNEIPFLFSDNQKKDLRINTIYLDRIIFMHEDEIRRAQADIKDCEKIIKDYTEDLD